jgi:hypothetical protein
MILRKVVAATALLLGCSLSHAASQVFSDDFDSYIPDQFDWSPPVSSGWTVTDGTVDLNGAGGNYDFLPGNGSYVDLDGSSFVSGVFSNHVNLVEGTTYLLSFDLAGSHRGTRADTVHVTFGSATASYMLGTADAFSTYSLSFKPGSSGNYSFSYLDVSGDNRGLFLDNVSVSAIPEPMTSSMLLGGLGLLGFLGHRRERRKPAIPRFRS